MGKGKGGKGGGKGSPSKSKKAILFSKLSAFKPNTKYIIDRLGEVTAKEVNVVRGI